LIPVVSALGGYFVLGERLSPLQWFGAVLVIAGVYLAMAAPAKLKEPIGETNHG
jgi:drug/metabolite transporter (DMT)-like permease